MTAGTARADGAAYTRPSRTWLRHLPIAVTLVLLISLFVGFSVPYPKLMAPQVVLNLFISNAHLIVLATGMTFVILTGGIDLSVGAVVALTTMTSAAMMQAGFSAAVAIPAMLLVGMCSGLLVGVMVQYFEVQPFIASLTAMFFARGLCYVISLNSIPIKDPFFTVMAQTKLYFTVPWFRDGSLVWIECYLKPSVAIALAIVAVAFWVLQYTRFGRTVYAIGGGQTSASLMGLAVARTKVAVYVVAGLCGALGGFLFALNTNSGYALTAVGMEMDVIASVVIGGTILTGGYGYVLGSVLGVLVLGLIQTLIAFDGTLSSWWTKIFIGALLLAFVVMQRYLTARKR